MAREGNLSKIVDILTYKKRYEDVFPSNILSESFDANTKEKIAGTYIFNPPNKSENPKKAAGNDSHSPSHKIAHLNAKFLHLFPWLISFLAILLLLADIAYRGKISVKIEIVGNGGGETNPASTKIINAQKKLLSDNSSTDAVYSPDLFIANGRTNAEIIKRMGFYGAALRDSRILKDGICLVNDGTIGWASSGFDMTEPADLTNSLLQFFVKGAAGSESLELILRDSDNNSYLPQARNRIFDKNMSSEWQFISVPFDSFKGYYNSKCVNHIGFEFGTQTTSNEPGASIYIRDIKIVKK